MTPDKLRTATRLHYETMVLAAVRRVASSLDEALDLQALAAAAHMAALHFHRIFRGLVGETPLQLHRRLRLERAALQLAEGDATVLCIALEAGYDTHEAFTRAFREAFGRAPTDHRGLARAARAALVARAGESETGCLPAPPHRLPATCGVHVDGPTFAVPADLSLRFLHHTATTMNVQIEDRPTIRVAALSHTGPYNTVGKTFERLGAIAGPAGLFADAGARMVAVYHDDPDAVPAGQLRSSAGVTIAAGLPVPAGLIELNLTAGRWARAVHRGSYAGLGEAWQHLLGHWLPQSGHRLGVGEGYELYLNHPGNVREDDLETCLYIPIAD